MKPAELRAELKKIMPGYKWTVKSKGSSETFLEAEGIQSSGFNRLSTLRVTWRCINGTATYEAKSAGSGTRSPWMHESKERTLARALRSLQEHYRRMANDYRSLEQALQAGRASNERPATAADEGEV